MFVRTYILPHTQIQDIEFVEDHEPYEKIDTIAIFEGSTTSLRDGASSNDSDAVFKFSLVKETTCIKDEDNICVESKYVIDSFLSNQNTLFSVPKVYSLQDIIDECLESNYIFTAKIQTFSTLDERFLSSPRTELPSLVSKEEWVNWEYIIRFLKTNSTQLMTTPIPDFTIHESEESFFHYSSLEIYVDGEWYPVDTLGTRLIPDLEREVKDEYERRILLLEG